MLLYRLPVGVGLAVSMYQWIVTCGVFTAGRMRDTGRACKACEGWNRAHKILAQYLYSPIVTRPNSQMVEEKHEQVGMYCLWSSLRRKRGLA